MPDCLTDIEFYYLIIAVRYHPELENVQVSAINDLVPSQYCLKLEYW
jgi:hypothetical protein